MKRLLLGIALLLAITGCTWGQVQQTQPTTETVPTDTTAHIEKPSLYDPQNPIEKASNGAIKGYTLESDQCEVIFMGEQLLLLYNDGFGPTQLVLLNGEDYSIDCEAELAGTVYVNDAGICASANGFGYYSEKDNAVIVLDSILREVSRVTMPKNLEDTPVICGDMKEAFYSIGSEIYCIDLESGISRLLSKRICESLTLQKSIFNDSVLVCNITQIDGRLVTEFISAESGETIGIDDEILSVSTWNNRYYLERMEGVVRESLFADVNSPLQVFIPQTGTDAIFNALPLNALVGVDVESDGLITLLLYDLQSGKILAQICVKDLTAISNVTADPIYPYVWFTAENQSGKVNLYCWNTGLSPVSDDTVYTNNRYTKENPDLEGLALCRTFADAIEAEYGIEIVLEEGALSAKDHVFVYEYHTQAFTKALEDLEETLSQFPEDFFGILGDNVSDSGFVHIGIVRDICEKAEGLRENPKATQFWSNGNAYIVLSVGETLQNTFCEELSYVLDTYIMNESLAYDDWDSLNPKDFVYDNNYTDYITREDTEWLEGEDRAFISSYSMTYPKEDRAEIFAYAMEVGNEDYFVSDVMQSKLKQICKGIREAFGWKKDERIFLWEQYLNVPLAYVKK